MWWFKRKCLQIIWYFLLQKAKLDAFSSEYGLGLLILFSWLEYIRYQGTWFSIFGYKKTVISNQVGLFFSPWIIDSGGNQLLYHEDVQATHEKDLLMSHWSHLSTAIWELRWPDTTGVTLAVDHPRGKPSEEPGSLTRSLYFMGDLEAKHHLVVFLTPRNCETLNVHCFKPQSMRLACYITTDK